MAGFANRLQHKEKTTMKKEKKGKIEKESVVVPIETSVLNLLFIFPAFPWLVVEHVTYHRKGERTFFISIQSGEGEVVAQWLEENEHAANVARKRAFFFVKAAEFYNASLCVDNAGNPARS